MRFLGLAAVLTFGLVVAPFIGAAQQAVKTYRIGSLVTGSAAGSAPSMAVFKQGLSELGYVEGKNFVPEPRYAETADALEAPALELTRLNVDVVVAATTTAAVAMKRATRTIPIVGVIIGDPIQSGLIDSLARPGGI
jgi:putative ABC transport system substrate-binding protein